jgi:4'-phosphopantetheinyl transferase
MAVVFCRIDSPRSELPDGATHVFSAALGDSAVWFPFLTESEQARAERLRLPGVRAQFVAARGQLRALLAHYLGISPRSVPVIYADGGKPHLPGECGLHFNVSHTEGLAVFAISRSRVGVDVEREREVPDADGLVSRFFATRECLEFHSLPTEKRSAAFLRAWTRKEAVLKAMGRGVQSLDCCEVTFGEADARIVCLDGDDRAGERWRMIGWHPAVGYQAAVAVEVPSTEY